MVTPEFVRGRSFVAFDGRVAGRCALQGALCSGTKSRRKLNQIVVVADCQRIEHLPRQLYAARAKHSFAHLSEHPMSRHFFWLESLARQGCLVLCHDCENLIGRFLESEVG